MATVRNKTAAQPAKAKAKANPAATRKGSSGASTRKATGVSAAPSAAGKESNMTESLTETLNKSLESVAPAVGKAASEFLNSAQSTREQVEGQVKNLMEKNMKTMNEFTEFTKGNVEALIESARAAASGAEVLASHFVDASKKSAEEAQVAFKTFSSARTPNEFIAAQNEYAKGQFDKLVANASKLSETWLKLAGEVVQPLSSRVAVAAESVKKNIAA